MDTSGTQVGERSGPPAWLPWLLAVWALVAWGGALSPGGPAFDDLEGVLENPLVNGERPASAALVSDYWHHRGDAGHYRPTALLSLALDHRLYGDDLRGYHATSLLLHAGVVLLAAKLLLAIGRARGVVPGVLWGWCLGLAVFATHPALADAVAWVSARSSTLAIPPGLLAGVILLKRAERAGTAEVATVAGLGMFACLLGKEDGYVGLVPIAAALVVRGRPWAGLGGAVVALLAWLAIRHGLYGTPLPQAPYSPLAELGLGQRLVVGGRVMLAGFGSLVGLFPRSPNHGGGDWQPDGALGLLGWALWSGLLVFAWRGRASAPARLGLAAGLFAWLPFQGWVPAGEVFAERFLYLPALLAAPLVGELFARLVARLFAGPRTGVGRSSAAHGLGVALALAAGAYLLLVPISTWQAARPYGSLLGYHAAVLEAYPGDATSWNGLALAREAAGDVDAARAAWERAIALDRGYGRPHSNLGRLALDAGDRAAALEHFEAAVAKGAGNPIAWANLGSLRLAMDGAAGSADAYLRATQLAPGMVVAWRGLARAYLSLGELDAAERAIEQALALSPEADQSLAVKANIALARGHQGD
ncbi:MAG: tetratricopeptide repeat protein [Planctomycetota bacterium]|nr:tetratricopeptide repeat protein [Planctomycetota bacterium]